MYRPIKRKIWSDPGFKKLKPLQRYLFLYLLTNNHSHISGLYHLPMYIIEHETDMDAADVENSLYIDLQDFCFYDEPTETVWVKNMLRHQSINKSIYISIIKQIRSLHPSGVIKLFWKTYGAEIEEATGMEMLDDHWFKEG